MDLQNISRTLARIEEIKARFGAASNVGGAAGGDFSDVLSQEIGGTVAAGGSVGSGVSGVPYSDIINSVSAKYGMDPALVAAVIKAESSFDPNTVSKAGAMGLMQLMPVNVKDYGVGNPYDPAQNIDGGVRHLKDMIDAFGGDLRLGLAAYNAGPNAVRRYGGIPPYAETQAYVPRVLGYYDQFKAQGATALSAANPLYPVAGSFTGSAVVQEAMKYLGVKYVWGGESPKGFDCSGLTSYAYKKFGIRIPRTAAEQSKVGTAVSRSQLQPGDLLFFRKNGRVHHVGIYIGNDTMLHAPHTGDVVKLTKLTGSRYDKQLTVARRYA